MSDGNSVRVPISLLYFMLNDLEWFLDDLGETIQAQQEDWTANSLTEDVESRERRAEKVNEHIKQLKQVVEEALKND